jgi:hypothetical protein
LRAVGAARIAPPPKRKYDPFSEAMAKPFGETAGRGPTREHGVEYDEDDRPLKE